MSCEKIKLSKSQEDHDHGLFLSGGFTRDAASLELRFLNTTGPLDPEDIVADRAKTKELVGRTLLRGSSRDELPRTVDPP